MDHAGQIQAGIVQHWLEHRALFWAGSVRLEGVWLCRYCRGCVADSNAQRVLMVSKVPDVSQDAVGWDSSIEQCRVCRTTKWHARIAHDKRRQDDRYIKRASLMQERPSLCCPSTIHASCKSTTPLAETGIPSTHHVSGEDLSWKPSRCSRCKCVAWRAPSRYTASVTLPDGTARFGIPSHS